MGVAPLRNAVQIRVSDNVLNWLLSAADREKVSASAIVRRILEQAAVRDLQRPDDEGQQG
jgi:hypothetical protein